MKPVNLWLPSRIPVKNVLGDIQGLWWLKWILKFMWDLINRLQIGQTGYAYVLDNKGKSDRFWRYEPRAAR